MSGPCSIILLCLIWIFIIPQNVEMDKGKGENQNIYAFDGRSWCERPVVRPKPHKNHQTSLWVQVRGSNTQELMWWREYAAPWAQWLILINSGLLTSGAEFIQHWLLLLLRDGFDGVTTRLTFKIALKKKRGEEQTGWLERRRALKTCPREFKWAETGKLELRVSEYLSLWQIKWCNGRLDCTEVSSHWYLL